MPNVNLWLKIFPNSKKKLVPLLLLIQFIKNKRHM